MNDLMDSFCSQMAEFQTTPFYIFPQEDYLERKAKSWIEMMIAGTQTIELYMDYWDADESENPEEDYEITDTFRAEVTFTEIYPWEYTVSVLVSWNVDAAKAAFQIKDGEICYISDFESEEDRESRCCLPNDVYFSEDMSEYQRGAVESLMETIRLCLCHAAGEE